MAKRYSKHLDAIIRRAEHHIGPYVYAVTALDRRWPKAT